MASVISISASVSDAAIRDFSRACFRFRDELGNTQAVAMRRGVIALIKSIRARTKASRKSVKLAAFAPYDGSGPHYITPKSGQFKGLPLHRFTKQGYRKHQPYVYTYAAASRTDAWKRHGKIVRHRLAKKSWGWFMQKLFHRAAPSDGNPRAVVRDDMVDGYLKEVTNDENPRVECLIVNNLDYIRDALESNALEDAMRAATTAINAQIDKGIAKARRELE